MTDSLEKVELALSRLLVCDIINAKDMTVFLHKVRDNMIKIPKATYREKENRWMMTVPASVFSCYKTHIKGSRLGQMKLNLIIEEDMLDYFKERIGKQYIEIHPG